jgi:hypothetical protein
MSQIAQDDLPKIVEYANKCFYAYSYWKAKFTMELQKPMTPERTIILQNNYDKVMNALTVCLNFILDCDHVLKDHKDILIFGVIHAGTKDVKTNNEKLLEAIEKYKIWYEARFKNFKLEDLRTY